MEGSKGEYKYTECGLSSVTIKDILVYRCTNCTAVVPEIPAAGVLHRVIALRLLGKKTLLAGSEIKFLRKLCGYSVNEFAEMVGSGKKSVVSRWEKEGCGKGTDKLIRMLVMAKLILEIAGQPKPILRNVTIEQLKQTTDEAIKFIEGKAKANERYIIDPEEIARYAGAAEESAHPIEIAVQ